MPVYEIRILNDGDARASLIVEQYHSNDQAAVRAAGQMARCAPFEVWQGIEMIYGMDPRNPGLNLARHS